MRGCTRITRFDSMQLVDCAQTESAPVNMLFHRPVNKRQVFDQTSADNFHHAIGPVLCTAQLFGVLPVAGIFNTNMRSVRFRWLHPKTLLATVVIVGASLECTLWIYYNAIVVHRIAIPNVAGIIFLGSILFGLLQMLRIAHGWPPLIRLWTRCEAVFLRPPYATVVDAHRMGRRVRCVTLGMLFIAMFEHVMYVGSAVNNARLYIEQCGPQNVSLVEYVLQRERPHMMWIWPYSAWMVLPLEYLNVAMTFCWSFVDVWIMAVSLGLAFRFDQIGERLELTSGRIMPESYWMEMHTQYLAMVDLVQRVDAQTSGLVLQSCASNLFFVCNQLFNSFREIPNAFNAAYFWLSLLFIIGRTLVMLFCASAVHEASRRPMAVLRNVPPRSWSTEVQRFATQCNTGEMVALSGKRFFYVRRSLILAMTGTVITYELVLLDQLKESRRNVVTCN